MPFSQSSQLSPILEYLEHLQPTSILDVGTGMGQYGYLARNNLENINLFEVDGADARQTAKPEWQIIIDGIEGCKVYHTPVHDYAYNNVFWSDAMNVLPTLTRRYDLVLAVDILEHFHKGDGLRFIELVKQVAQKAVVVSTPKEFIEQEVEANPYENHRSLWGSVDLINCGFKKFIDNPLSWIAVYQTET